MRLFVALDPPEEVRREVAAFPAAFLAAFLAERRRSSETGDVHGGKAGVSEKWVPAENLHLTLHFLGEVDPDAVPALREALSEAFGAFEPFRMAVRGGGTFPPGRPARVAWLGIEAPEALPRLQAEVASRAAASLGGPEAGYEVDRRPYHPHLTLARMRRPWKRPAVEAFARAADRAFGEPFTVREGRLVESRLGGSGARYRTVESFSLGDQGRG